MERPFPQPPSASELFGYVVHHTLRARFCIERGRFWQAGYWISAGRDYALDLACLRGGLPVSHGRGFDHLPAEVVEPFTSSFVVTLEREELLRALSSVIEGLLPEVDGFEELAGKAAPQLRELRAEWDDWHLP